MASERARAAALVPVDVSLLSHVLLTPLSGIVMWCQMLERQPQLPPTVKRGLHAIDHGARAQVAILENLVEMSRLHAGDRELHRTRVDVVAGAHDVVAQATSAAEPRGVLLVFAGPAAPCFVEGDPARLRCALRNVVDNAVAASSDGGRVEVTVEETVNGVVFSVADAGSGLTPATWARLLVLGDLREARAARRHGGLGLGLPITRHLVDLHGGTLVMRPNTPRGCQVVITLPRAP